MILVHRLEIIFKPNWLVLGVEYSEMMKGDVPLLGHELFEIVEMCHAIESEHSFLLSLLMGYRILSHIVHLWGILVRKHFLVPGNQLFSQQ